MEELQGRSCQCQDKEHIRQFISTLCNPPFGSQIRLVLADAPRQGFGKVRGTYGVVTGASSFLIGVLKRSERCFLDYGYLFEAAILDITSLGLGTCWMGGTFDRTFFSEMAQPLPDEIIPSMSPVGVIAQKRSPIDTMFALTAGSRKRKPWSSLFFQDSFGSPLHEGAAQSYALPLEMIRLAPSASTKQPWRIVMNETGFPFFLARTFGYSMLFKDVDLQGIDLGIAMFHFEQTIEELGLQGSWSVLPPGITPLPARTEYVVSWVI
jgi:hypothetical protein